MSSHVPYILAVALTRTQSSYVLAGAVRCRPLLTSLNAYPQIRSVFLRPFMSFSCLLHYFPGLFLEQGAPKQRSWTPKASQSFSSKRPIKTINQGTLEHSLGKRSLEGPRGPDALILHQYLRNPLRERSWLQNEFGRQILRRSSTDNRGKGGPENAPLPKESGAQVEKGIPESSKYPASSIANKHIIDRLPSIPHIHRPTKEELLAAATGFWSRLKVRFKWFSIRSVRPFNVDEIGAFFSWVLLGHVLWIILGTTTFFSLAIFAVNTVFAQGMGLSPSSYVQLTAVQKLWLGG